MPRRSSDKKRPWMPENLAKFTLVFDRKNVLIVAAFFTLLLFPLGIFLYSNNASLNQVILNYTECKFLATPSLAAPTQTNISGIQKWKFDPASQQCTLEFLVPTTMKQTVHMYVRITNFYQNHQLYVKSADPAQLAGQKFTSVDDIPSAESSASTQCSWLLYGSCARQTATFSSTQLTLAQQNPDCIGTPDALIANALPSSQYYPCGLVANSMFSDDISDLTCVGQQCRIPTFSFSQTGIAWPEDQALYGTTKWKGTVDDATLNRTLIPPPQWRKSFPLWKDGYTNANLPDLASWERLQVWMRKAALPTFRKLWGRQTDETLDAGVWQVTITDSWDALRFQGTKSLVFADVGVLGPRNDFLPIMFLGVASASLFCAIVVAVLNPRKMGDLELLSWKNQ